MFCRRCGAELEEGLPVCPVCGEQQNTMDKKLKIAVTVLCIALLAAVLTVVIVMSLKDKDRAPTGDGTVQVTEPSNEQETEDRTEETQPTVSYTVSDDVLVADRDMVVLKLGDYEMTVADLQLHYWFQALMYYENNEQNIAYGYVKLDILSPLDQQDCTENPTISWQQFFVNKTIAAWKSYAIMNMMADEEGFELPADHMEKLKADTLLDAQGAGFETADEYVVSLLRKDVGATVTAEDYWRYMELVNRATLYFAQWQEKAIPTEAELELYFKENEQTLKNSGITKDIGSLVDVRHILIMVENGDWAAAEKEANDILQQWKAGGATEELFAQLANKYSDDGGSNTTGGLYTDVQPGQMVEVFNNWIMDSNRQYGDSAVLKADYYYQGYHVMFFVSGEPIWKLAVEQAIVAERTAEMSNKGQEKWPMERTDENIKLGTPAFE